MTETQLRAIENSLKKAIDFCNVRGTKILPNEYGTRYDKTCSQFVHNEKYTGVCPLGALLLYTGKRIHKKITMKKTWYLVDHEHSVLAALLGVEPNWIMSFTAGFDEHSTFLTDRLSKKPDFLEAYKMGTRLRSYARIRG